MKLPHSLALLALCACASQSTNSNSSELMAVEIPEQANQLEQHRWLNQLVGTWNVRSETVAQGDAEPTVWEFEEVYEPMGGHWVLGKMDAEYQGQAFRSLMTLGYDPAAGTFVGSWIDTMQTKMWTYVGERDAAGRVLTLKAYGPHMSDPEKSAVYRDVIEFVDADTKNMTSSVQLDDGSWSTFMTATARRAK